MPAPPGWPRSSSSTSSRRGRPSPTSALGGRKKKGGGRESPHSSRPLSRQLLKQQHLYHPSPTVIRGRLSGRSHVRAIHPHHKPESHRQAVRGCSVPGGGRTTLQYRPHADGDRGQR